MILNQNGEAFTGDPFFNADFIQRNKIKTIKGQYSFKKNKDLIRSVPGNYIYEFNKEGRLIASIDIRWNGKSLDTTLKHYEYNKQGLIISLKKSEDGGVTLWAYTNTEKELSIEGIGWDALWTSKLHVEASEYTEGRYIPLTNMMSW